MDIEPTNIVMSSDGTVKLCDFRIATVVDGALLAEFRGSPAFTAPEVCAKLPCDPFKADVWSLGVIMFNLAIEQANKMKRSVENRSCQMGI
jgi:serine/threonine protein kinase